MANQDEEKAKRLAAALRDNLRKRKARTVSSTEAEKPKTPSLL
jgi:hypothetical protein